MDKQGLYDRMASRKSQPKDFNTYIGDNGRVNRCVQLIKQGKIRTGGTLLDVGGGIGDLCYQVKKDELFKEAIALDISRKNLAAAESKAVTTLISDVDMDGIPSDDGRFDVVTALDFIEHIIDPEYFARECFRVLKPSGQVFINTPNIQYFEHLESLVYRGVFPHTSGDHEVYHGGHLAFFGQKDLVDIFTSAGFNECQQIKDEAGYQTPPELWVNFLSPKNQIEYIDCCMKLGNPNLLFRCIKPVNT